MSKTLAELKALPTPELAAQWQRSTAALAAAKTRHELVHAALEARYGKRARSKLTLEHRTDGTVRLEDGALELDVKVPGRDQIDQDLMTAAIARLESGGVAWRTFVKVEYSITRIALRVLPDQVRAVLEPAIATRTGKLGFLFRPRAAVPAKLAA